MEYTATLKQMQFSGVPVTETQSDFYLYPLKGTHKAKDVQQAKHWLKNNRKGQIRYIVVEWQLRDSDEPLNKIPDMAIISHLRTELGKKEAYIEELEEKLVAKEQLKPTPEQIKEIRAQAEYVQLKKNNKGLHKTIKSLRRGNRELITKVLELNGTLPKGMSEHDFDDPQSEEE
jgi:hypothetical protein